MIKHKHHIIPKHMGGSNDETNLVELTIEEHAEAHKILYEKYGLIEDYLAWKGLSGQIGKEQILKEIYSNNAKKMNEKKKGKPAWNKGLTKDDPRVKKYSDKLTGVPKTKEHIENLKKPKKDTSNMGKYQRTEEQKEKLKLAAASQYSAEGRKKHSEIMKSRRKTCSVCGMESNTSNIIRHEKKCKLTATNNFS